MRSIGIGMFAMISSLAVGCITPGEESVGMTSPIVGEVHVEARSAPTMSSAYRAISPAQRVSTETRFATKDAVREPTPLALDACDDPDFAGQKYVDAKRDHVVIRYLPGTAVDRDLEQIATVRNALFESTADLFGIVDRSPVTFVMSPNRLAAQAHGYDYGAAWSLASHIEVIYGGTPEAYEVRSPGHELVHVLSARIDNVGNHMPMLSEGLAEVLDGSGRDPHASYAAALRAGLDYDTGTGSVTRFTAADVWGDTYDRAASFVKFVIDRYGIEKFKSLWKGSAITYAGWGFNVSGGALVSTTADLERELDRLTREVYGASLDAIRIEWAAALKPYLSAPVRTLSDADLVEIENLIANVDRAITTGNASVYRTAMEGFYCDYETDAGRDMTAKTAVEGRGTVKTTMVSAYPTGGRNFATALVHATRTEERGGVTSTTTSRLWLEHYPVGWRLTFVDGL